jgi:hypothetical protein
MLAPVYMNSVEWTKFPVQAYLRDEKTIITVDKDTGSVTAKTVGSDTSGTTIASHNTSLPSYRAFLEFWGVVFGSLSKTSIAFNQLVAELKAGRLRQDEDCPYLFMDMTQPHGGIEGAFALLKADHLGELSDYNPDPHYVNQAFGLAEDNRIKFYTVIEDFEGNDFPVGYAVGVSRVPGQVPEFNLDSTVRNKEGILKIAKRHKSGHSMSITPEMYLGRREPELAGDFEDDCPF